MMYDIRRINADVRHTARSSVQADRQAGREVRARSSQSTTITNTRITDAISVMLWGVFCNRLLLLLLSCTIIIIIITGRKKERKKGRKKMGARNLSCLISLPKCQCVLHGETPRD